VDSKGDNVEPPERAFDERLMDARDVWFFARCRARSYMVVGDCLKSGLKERAGPAGEIEYSEVLERLDVTEVDFPTRPRNRQF
jgi:hypothetical protein